MSRLASDRMRRRSGTDVGLQTPGGTQELDSTCDSNETVPAEPDVQPRVVEQAAPHFNRSASSKLS
jgi:hypothetical protein